MLRTYAISTKNHKNIARMCDGECFLCVWRVYTRSGCSFRLERLFTHISDKMWTQNDTIQVQITYMRKTFTNIIFNSMNCNYFSKSHSQQVAIPKPPTPTHVFLALIAVQHNCHAFFVRKIMLTKPEMMSENVCLFVCGSWYSQSIKSSVIHVRSHPGYSCSLNPQLAIKQ